jgi:hypothetical protein
LTGFKKKRGMPDYVKPLQDVLKSNQIDSGIFHLYNTLMYFDFKVIATSFPAIALVISLVCFLIGDVGLGWLFALVAIGSFVLAIFANRS